MNQRNEHYESLYSKALKDVQAYHKAADVPVDLPSHTRRDWYARFIKQYATGAQVKRLVDGMVEISFLDKDREYVGGYVVPNYVVRDVIDSILG